MKTSQIALPKETCDEVYAESGYEQSVANLSRTSLSSRHGVRRRRRHPPDRVDDGSVEKGYVAALTIGV